MPKNSTITPDRTSRLPPPKNRRMPSMMKFGGCCARGCAGRCAVGAEAGAYAAAGGRGESGARGAAGESDAIRGSDAGDQAGSGCRRSSKLGWTAADGVPRASALRRSRSSSSVRRQARMWLRSAMAKPAKAPINVSKKRDPALPRVAPANPPTIARTIRMTGSIADSPCKTSAHGSSSRALLCRVERSMSNRLMQGSFRRSAPHHAVILRASWRLPLPLSRACREGLRLRFLDRMRAGFFAPQLREFRVLPQAEGEDGRPAMALLERQARVLMGELLVLVGEAANGGLQSQHG